MTKKPATKSEKEHMGRVAELGCIVCKKFHGVYSPALIHHITTMRSGFGSRSKHTEVLPLCFNHHDAKIKGVSIHEGVKVWEEKYGTQKELLKEVNDLIS